MSLINQDVRYAERGDSNNPDAIYEMFKPPRFIADIGIPDPSIGQDCWHYIDTTTSIEYVKIAGVWTQYVNIAAIVAPGLPPVMIPDNLTADSLSNKNTNDLSINAVQALMLSSGDVSIDSTTTIVVDAINDITIATATGKIGLTATELDLSAVAGGIKNVNNIETTALGNLTITSADSIYLTAGAGSTIYPTAAIMYCAGITSGINGIVSLTGKSATPFPITSTDTLDLSAGVGFDINLSGGALDCVGIPSGVVGLKSIDGQNGQPLYLTSDRALSIAVGLAFDIELIQGSNVNCNGITNGFIGVKAITGKTGQTLTVSSTAALQLTAQSGQGISMSGASIDVGAVAGGVQNLVSINNGNTNTKFLALGTNNVGSLQYISTGYSVDGVIVNIAVAAGNQYWEFGGAAAPADFWTVPVPTAGGTTRLTGVAATFSHNTVGWNITSGSITLRVGYVAAGLPIVIANLTTIYTSAAFGVGVAYPYIDADNLSSVVIPIGARIVAFVVKGAGVNLSATGADVSLLLKFN